MRLSEAPDHALRMSDLAQAASISPSRMTRIIQSMITDGLVARRVVAGDGRASLATLTDAGLQRLKGAWPAHLAGVRTLVLDHIDPDDLADFNRVMRRLLSALENTIDESSTSDAPGDGSQGAALGELWRQLRQRPVESRDVVYDRLVVSVADDRRRHDPATWLALRTDHASDRTDAPHRTTTWVRRLFT